MDFWNPAGTLQQLLQLSFERLLPQCPSPSAADACGCSADQESGRASALCVLWPSCSRVLAALGCPGAPGPGVTLEGTCHQCCWWLNHSSQSQKLGKHTDPGGFFPRGVLSAEGVSFQQSSTAQGLSELTHPSTATHRYLPHSEIPESGPRWVTCPQTELSGILQLPSASARLSLYSSGTFSLCHVSSFGQSRTKDRVLK